MDEQKARVRAMCGGSGRICKKCGLWGQCQVIPGPRAGLCYRLSLEDQLGLESKMAEITPEHNWKRNG